DAARQGLEALAEGIVLLERTGTAVYVTGPARDLVGRKFASAAELTPGALRAACERMLESATPEELEFETAGRTVAAAVLPVPSGGGVVVLRDVTEVKRSDRIRRDFVSNASHELKTPVSSKIGRASCRERG